MPALLTAYIVTAIAWTLLSLWLSARQIACVRRHRDAVPADFAGNVTIDEHRKAADYTVARERLAGVRTVWDLIVSLGWVLGGINLLYGVLAGVLPPSPALGVAFLVASFAIGALLSLPLDLYKTFVVEQRFGFNRSTPVMFAVDRVKSWAIGLAVAVPLLFACLWAMHAFSGLWWLWTWVGVVLLMLAAPTIYVRLIAPRFNKFTPLQDGELRSRIETLLRRCGFRPSGLFSMDASRRSAHGNAFFIGFGKTKRVVLFDTLISASTPDEIEAVVAHELGHDKHGHVLFGLLRSAAMAFAMLAAFGWLSKQAWLLPGFGIGYQDDALALLACLLVVGMVGPLLAPISNWMSRRNEFQADDFARRQVAAGPMINALLRLSRDNASTLTPDAVYALVHYSHPPVPLRIRELHAAEAREMVGAAAE
ncbi:MAG TPA: M48 family metallopeptidase [Acetobacteraceae bacterium]|nr:M48 family metallopeptidase [Acetobacteraceae bacterium]